MGLKDLNLDIIIGRLLQCKVDYQAIKLKANEANIEGKHGLANSLNRRAKMNLDKYKFYENKLKDYGMGNVVTVSFILVPLNMSTHLEIGDRFRATYVNVTKEEAKQLVELYASINNSKAIIKELEEINTQIRRL